MRFSLEPGRLPIRRSSTAVAILVAFSALLFTACSSSTSPTDTGGFTGTLTYEETLNGVKQFDLSKKTAVTRFEGRSPSAFASGEIVVLGPSAGTMEIVSANGATRKEIYSSKRSYGLFGPKVSPSGTMIAFTESAAVEAMTEPNDIKTVVIDLDGNVIVEIDGLGSPSWTSDGRIVLSGSWLYPHSLTSKPITPDGVAAIYVVDAAFTTVTQVSDELDKPLDPTMSADGSHIAFTLNGHLWTMKSDGTNIKQITTGSKAESFPTWSPDGKNIVCICFGTFETSYYNAVAVVPADPTAATVMSNDANVWIFDSAQTTDIKLGRVSAVGSIGWR